MPATASTKRAVSVATPERWPRKLSAVRSAASSARAGPVASSTSAGTSSRHCPSTTRLSTSSTPHWRIASATAARPKTTPGCFCTIRARAAGVLGNGRLRGHVAGADVLGERAGDGLAQCLAGSAIAQPSQHESHFPMRRKCRLDLTPAGGV